MAATVKYISQKHGESTLGWAYDDFKAVGLKSFPATHKILFQTTSAKKKQNVMVTINMSEVTTKDNWEATTKISDRYKQIQAQDALKKIMRSEEHTSELQSRQYLVCRLLLEKKKHTIIT